MNLNKSIVEQARSAAWPLTAAAPTFTQHYYHHQHQLVPLNGGKKHPADAHTHTVHTHTNTHTQDRRGELIGFNGRRPQTNTRSHTDGETLAEINSGAYLINIFNSFVCVCER